MLRVFGWLALLVWVPNMLSPHAACEYSWIRPPSRSVRRTLTFVLMAGGCVGRRVVFGRACGAVCGCCSGRCARAGPAAGAVSPVISIRSGHSRRALAIQRSAIAFARGAWTGVLMMRVPAAVRTASDAAVNLVPRSRIKDLIRAAWPSRVIRRLRACWVARSPAGWGGDPGQVHAAGAVLDEGQGVEALEEDGAGVEEVCGQDRGGLAGQGLAPGACGTAGAGARVLEDLPRGGWREAVAGAGLFAVDALAQPVC